MHVIIQAVQILPVMKANLLLKISMHSKKKIQRKKHILQRRRGVRNSQRIANRKQNDGKGENEGDNVMDVNLEKEKNADDYQKGVETKLQQLKVNQNLSLFDIYI